MWRYSTRTSQHGAINNARGFEAEVPGNERSTSIHSAHCTFDASSHEEHHALQALLEEAQRQKQIFLNFVRDEGADDALIKASHSAFKIKNCIKAASFLHGRSSLGGNHDSTQSTSLPIPDFFRWTRRLHSSRCGRSWEKLTFSACWLC